MKIYIDGSAGTTGLQIYDRLSVRRDLELVTLPDALADKLLHALPGADEVDKAVAHGLDLQRFQIGHTSLPFSFMIISEVP